MLSAQKGKLSAGEGHIRVERHGQKATLSELAFSYPCKLMPPTISAGDASLAFGLVCLYMLTYGGGLVSGDTINLKVELEEQCHLVLLTQGNTKVFRYRPGGSYNAVSTALKPSTYQLMQVNIAPSSSIFLLPAPVTCFERASYSQYQSFHLADPATSSLLLLDWFTSGRLSRGESWAFDKYRSCNEIYISGKRIINDILLLEGKDIARRMASYSCYCTLFICGKELSTLLDHFRRLADGLTQFKRNQPEDVIWSFSELEAGTCGAVRCAGKETEAVREWLAEQLRPLIPIIGKDMYKAAFV